MGMTQAEKHQKVGMKNGIRIGMKIGMRIGMQIGARMAIRELLLDFLTARFEVSDAVRKTINKTQDIDQLKAWTRMAWKCQITARNQNQIVSARKRITDQNK